MTMTELLTGDRLADCLCLELSLTQGKAKGDLMIGRVNDLLLKEEKGLPGDYVFLPDCLAETDHTCFFGHSSAARISTRTRVVQL